MCRGKGTPGSSTRSRGNKDSSALTIFPYGQIGDPLPLNSTPCLDMLRSARYKPGMASNQGVRQLAGKVAAKLFADHGARVVLLSRDAGRVEAARARIGHPDETLALACDVRNREEIDRAIGLTMHHFGRIDIWVNNAGHGILDSVATANMAAVRETFDTNFFGTLESMQAVIPIMKQQGGGAIVNISSVAGHIPLPY